MKREKKEITALIKSNGEEIKSDYLFKAQNGIYGRKKHEISPLRSSSSTDIFCNYQPRKRLEWNSTTASVPSSGILVFHTLIET